MSQYSSSYNTDNTDNTGMGDDNTAVQTDFKNNLDVQLNSIKQLQDQQLKLYSKLEVLGARTDISTTDVQNQINDIFAQIETLNSIKNTIFQSLLTSYQVNQSQLNASRYAYADSITALEIIEQNLADKQQMLNEAIAIRDNSERMVGVNTYYTRRYEEHSKILKYIILFCGIIILSIFLMKIGIINNSISSIIIIASLSVGIIIIGRKVWDLSRRSNIDYDQYNFKSMGARPDTINSVSVKTDMTYGGNIFGNICNRLASDVTSVENGIKNATGDNSVTPTGDNSDDPSSNSSTQGTGTGTGTGMGTGTGTGMGTGMGMGTGTGMGTTTGSGNIESFLMKSSKSKMNSKYNMDGHPLARSETFYNSSDYHTL